jgi:tripartite-type tricarboxylate transporter receptor subunit TctC
MQRRSLFSLSASAAVRETLAAADIELAGGTSQAFADFIGSEMLRWGQVAKAAGVQPE